jgi:uncharacterized RDD family membrane protein YckC
MSDPQQGPPPGEESPPARPAGATPPPPPPPPPGYETPVGTTGRAPHIAAAAPLVSNGKRFGAFLLEGVLAVVTLGIGWLIWALIVWRHGQTPAKQLLSMRCVYVDTNEAATWGTMALREIVGKAILGNLTASITTIVSAFMILFGEKRQGIWDLIARTIVVDESRV